MSKYEIRIARDDAEREAAFNLRYALYVEAQGLFADVADHERRVLVDAIDEHAMIFVAEHEGEIVGTLRVQWCDKGLDPQDRELFDIDGFTDLVDESEIAIGSRQLVHPDHRGSPLSMLLQIAMIEELVARGTELLLADCEPHLVNTWSRLGHRPYGLCEHPTNGTLVRLAVTLGDGRYVEKIDSPFAPALAKWTKTGYTSRRLSARIAKTQRIISEAKDSDQFWAAVEETLSLEDLAKLLGGLGVDELDALLGNSHALDCAPGSALIRKGHASRTLYVLLTGALEVWDEDERVAVVEEPGAILGEVALFAGSRRMSDVITSENGARVLALSERNLQQLIQAQGAGAAKLLLMMTRSLSCKLLERGRSST